MSLVRQCLLGSSLIHPTPSLVGWASLLTLGHRHTNTMDFLRLIEETLSAVSRADNSVKQVQTVSLRMSTGFLTYLIEKYIYIDGEERHSSQGFCRILRMGVSLTHVFCCDP